MRACRFAPLRHCAGGHRITPPTVSSRIPPRALILPAYVRARLNNLMSTNGIEKRGSATTVKACDSCRKRKRRCLWTAGAQSCNYCVQLKEECTTTHIRKQRAKSQKKDRIIEYERRIKNLESLLNEQNTTQPQMDAQPLEPADQAVSLSTWVDNLRSQVDAIPDVTPLPFDLDNYYDAELEPFPLPMNGHSTPSTGNDGSTPGTSLGTFEQPVKFQFDPALLQDPAFQALSTADDLSSVQTAPSLGDLSSVQTAPSIDNFSSVQTAPSLDGLSSVPTAPSLDGLSSVPTAPSLDDLSAVPTATPKESTPPVQKKKACDAYLPPPELGTMLLKEYLVDSNTVFPLYRPHAIVEHLRICYEGRSDNSALAWASTYAVFGLAHRSRGLSATATVEDDQLADWYLCKILPTLSSLLVSEPTFGLVQCLLGLAMLIRSSKHYSPHGLYVSTALRIAQSLAYIEHEQLTESPANLDIDHQRRVLWLAFIMDTEDSIFTNLPSTHRREDLPKSCPVEDPHDALGIVTAAEGTLKINTFALRVQLVLIQSDAIEDIFSIRSRKSKPQDTIGKARQILQRLEEWRNNELCRRTPEQLMQLLYRSDLLHTMSIEASYFATVFRIHAFLGLGMDPRMNPFSATNLTKLSAMKRHACRKDAEHFLGILSLTPHDEIGVCWLLKSSIIAALVTVLAHYLHAPAPEAPSPEQMKAWSGILRSMGLLIKESEDVELTRAHELGMMLFTQVDSSLRVKWLQEQVVKGGTGRL
ncbi:unnamed protein product [Periconia digitata]|uniref:Zn(2)-C6 fungal-type domain-containing protein n=1 Tax=Periconia digitata TaxID=1303443 RepID=A0A9W4UNJ5_9PLEO|nr:unnamed protein product [Periconia digitata]